MHLLVISRIAKCWSTNDRLLILASPSLAAVSKLRDTTL